jgi:glycosyltransferase involved in cell wall biosynthesis
MIEAMACGTPVVAFGHGAVPEVIEDGVTGFVVKDLEQAIAAAERVHRLDRTRVRARFEERFTAQRMAQRYVGVYESTAGLTRAADPGKELLCQPRLSSTISTTY